MQGPCAIGRIGPDGPWIGFQAAAPGYRLVVGTGSGVRSREADADLLLALAIAYFEEAFDDAPPEVEATHADLGELVRHVAAQERDGARTRLLSEAVDAIDDGLAGDAVANRLNAARSGTADEQADPVDLLVTLTEELLRN
ncbi:MAG TPA: hypothetical protein VFH90_06185 [Candidatus Limnocylindria bacterium]|nr:hypothetical protein [Candidatus Limnocylindria bacterium]